MKNVSDSGGNRSHGSGSSHWISPVGLVERSATLLSCVPLDGSELDAKGETLSLERPLQVCIEADQGAINRTVALASCL